MYCGGRVVQGAGLVVGPCRLCCGLNPQDQQNSRQCLEFYYSMSILSMINFNIRPYSDILLLKCHITHVVDMRNADFLVLNQQFNSRSGGFLVSKRRDKTIKLSLN
uniref:Uncharacterized protein n=1 Tax=Cacopsylla melanoneura TaxID=428564 RepID=A0A8D8WHK2_9HEMI